MPSEQNITPPEERFGFRMGADRQLARWADMLDYFQEIARQSPRMQYEQIGLTTESRPMVLLTITSPENHRQLNRLQQIQRHLADQRDNNETDREQLIANGLTIVLLTCSIHATEIGSVQMTPELVYELVTRDDSEIHQMLDNVVLLLVPSLNPDGMDLVHDWYQKTLDTPAEGSAPPGLYHPYSGHDNNRDWYMLTQVETRNVIERVHNVWHPHIVFDQHQMMSDGPRYVLPPFIDPYDPNVDPLLQAQTADIGTAMAADMTSADYEGVATQIIFDAFSPSRAYQHYHGGIRILSEAASCRIASPVDLAPHQLREVRGFNPRIQRWNHPLPWSGGRWTLRHIVDYNKRAVYACLRHAARNRDQWVRNFARIQQRALEAKKPTAFIIPRVQRDPGTAMELIETLQRGLVEIEEATSTFTAAGVEHAEGSHIIRMAQPFGAFAKTLLETQYYPDLRVYPNGPPQAPYDITAHSLPLYMGVDAIPVDDDFTVESVRITGIPAPHGTITGTGDLFLLPAETNASVKAINRLLDDGATVWRAIDDMMIEDQSFKPGTWIVDGLKRDTVNDLANEYGLTFHSVEEMPHTSRRQLTRPRVGLYRSWCPNVTDEGWTRFILEEYGFTFASLRDQEIRQGKLVERYDVIILPSQGVDQLLNGNDPRIYPAEYAGGIGDRGGAHLRRFVETGGTLIALDAACDIAMRHLYLPVINRLEGLSDSEFYSPGSVLQMLVDPRHPIGYGYEREVPGLMTGRMAFDALSGSDARPVARYPANNQLLSGWILGEEQIRGASALIDVPVNDGHAILFGFRPQFRAQTRGTYRLLFNAIYSATLGDTIARD